MPPEQSKELAAAYEKAGLPVKLALIPKAVYGVKVFYAPEHIVLMTDFIEALPAK